MISAIAFTIKIFWKQQDTMKTSLLIDLRGKTGSLIQENCKKLLEKLSPKPK